MALKYQAIYDVVKSIPPGKVAAYGQIAKLAGFPRGARLVGYALGVAPESLKLPWYRVINSAGRISPRGYMGSDDYQRLLLEDEGVEFGLGGKINLKKHLWELSKDV